MNFSTSINLYYFVYGWLCAISPIIYASQSTSILEAIIGVLFPTVLLGYLIADATSRKE
ncbi:hypothetical protein [Flavobacterium sp.]|uniref:hypothetical protein n=1 Tax=Flavobacterium sp. TaxID=239 RepID=UPI00262E331E|nr:hypothetical protein [Flavobacterium sp.]MDD2985684.1 hypothetical protein [Flavobacterium sp.]